MIKLDTDHYGQIMIDMPAGKARHALLAKLRAGKCGPSGRSGGGVPPSLIAQLWEIGGRPEQARMVRDNVEWETRWRRPRRAAAGPSGSDPLTVADLVSLYTALGNRWGAAVLRSAHALRLGPDNTPRALSPTEVATLSTKPPAFTGWAAATMAGPQVVEEPALLPVEVCAPPAPARVRVAWGRRLRAAVVGAAAGALARARELRARVAVAAYTAAAAVVAPQVG